MAMNSFRKLLGEVPVTENEVIALGLASAIILVGIALA